MEVTRSNFQDALTELDEVLKNATFLAIDGEFTGLNSGPDASAFDTPAQYYDKLRTGSMDFLLVQFGLSAFTYNSVNDKYSQRSYNFYVFPQQFNRSMPDHRFLCQASSISFLVNQGFDFNKLFKFGIPYLTKSDEEKLNKKLEEKQKLREENFDLIPIPDDDKVLIEEICLMIEDFINSEKAEITINKCNAFIRRLIFQEVRLRWPNKVRLESKNENGNQFLAVYKVGSKEEEEKIEADKREKEKLEVQEAVGLSALLRKIADSGKLIVGHNMLLDLCHIIHQFYGPLPESYTDFKSLVHCLFPKLLDTKIMCQSATFKDSVPSILNQLIETIHSSPFSIPEIEEVENRSYTLGNDKLHEAGYDAFVTGVCFITLCNRLGSLQKPEVSTVLPDSPLLNLYLNKLLIARLKDYPHINLTGKDPNPSRDHVFHMTFPKQWKHSDLSQLFTPYGGAYVSWLSDTTAYIALYRRDQVNAVVKNLFKSTQYSLRKYKDHQANLENEKSVKIERKVERKRKISERDSPSKDSLPKPSEGGSTTAPGSDLSATGTASSTLEQDGWEVASAAVEPDLQIASTTRYTILSDLVDPEDEEDDDDDEDTTYKDDDEEKPELVEEVEIVVEKCRERSKKRTSPKTQESSPKPSRQSYSPKKSRVVEVENANTVENASVESREAQSTEVASIRESKNTVRKLTAEELRQVILRRNRKTRTRWWFKVPTWWTWWKISRLIGMLVILYVIFVL